MVDFLNNNSGAIQAISTIFLVIITGFYVWFTGKTVNIMKKAEDERSRPRIIVYIQQRENWLNLVDLVIGNYGIDVARDINFTLNENLVLWKESETLLDIDIIKNGIRNLVPRQVLKIPLLSLVGRIDELNKKNIVISVIYKDGVGIKSFSDNFSIDFNSLIEHQIGEPPIYTISNNIEKCAKALERIEQKVKIDIRGIENIFKSQK